MKINSMEELDHLIQMMDLYKLDAVEVDGIRLVKTKHNFLPPAKPENKTEDEDLFWSANG